MDIQRETFDLTVALTADATTTPTIGFQKAVCGTIHIPSGSPITSLTWYSGYTAPATASEAEAATVFLPAYDSAATPAAVTQTVAAGRSYPIPVALAGSRFLRCVVNSAGTAYITWKT